MGTPKNFRSPPEGALILQWFRVGTSKLRRSISRHHLGVLLGPPVPGFDADRVLWDHLHGAAVDILYEEEPIPDQDLVPVHKVFPHEFGDPLLFEVNGCVSTGLAALVNLDVWHIVYSF